MRDQEKRSGFKFVLDFLKRLLGKKPTQPGDPYAYVTSPLRRCPKGRSGAAVAEIEEDSFRSFPRADRSPLLVVCTGSEAILMVPATTPELRTC